MMQRAYAGESFELVFRMTDAKDPERKVDSATYRVLAPDKVTVLQAGTMSIDTDGQTMRFRFNATELGVCTVEVTWVMGLDHWINPYLVSVEDPVR